MQRCFFLRFILFLSPSLKWLDDINGAHEKMTSIQELLDSKNAKESFPMKVAYFSW